MLTVWSAHQRRQLAQTPYVDALMRQTATLQANFHSLPIGQLDRRLERSAMDSRLLALLGEEFLCHETTLAGSVMDSFFRPRRCLQRSQELTATAFGADFTMYVTSGSTVANQVAVEALQLRDRPVVVDRQVHQSLHFALDRVGARVIYTAGSIVDARSRVSLTSAVTDALARGDRDRPVALFVGATDYDGLRPDLRALFDRVHALTADWDDFTIVVDEAWAAIHAFHPQLRPMTALAAFREQLTSTPNWPARLLVTHSAHKTMFAPRQASYLHAIGDPGIRTAVENALYRVHTTSPSLPVLAGLDLARAHAVVHGSALVDASLEQVQRLTTFLESGRGGPLKAAERDIPHGSWLDPLRLMVDCGSPERAAAVRRDLYQDHGIYVVRAIDTRLLFHLHIGVTHEQVTALIHAFEQIAAEPAGDANTIARFVVSYPPGVPLRVPGENPTPVAAPRAGDELFATF